MKDKMEQCDFNKMLEAAIENKIITFETNSQGEIVVRNQCGRIIN